MECIGIEIEECRCRTYDKDIRTRTAVTILKLGGSI